MTTLKGFGTCRSVMGVSKNEEWMGTCLNVVSWLLLLESNWELFTFKARLGLRFMLNLSTHLRTPSHPRGTCRDWICRHIISIASSGHLSQYEV